MLREQESKSKLEGLTDPEVYSAIRYLDAELECIECIELEPDPITFVLGITLVVQLLGCIGIVWFYQWTH